MTACLALLLLVSAVLAQDEVDPPGDAPPPGQGPAPADPVSPQPQAAPPVDAGTRAWARTAAWRRVSPEASRGFVGLAVDPADGTRLAAIDGLGAVWLSNDAGGTWMRALGPVDPSDVTGNEFLRLEVETAIEDDGPAPDLEAAVDDLIDAADPLEPDTDELADQLQALVDDALASVGAAAEDAAARAEALDEEARHTRPRVWRRGGVVIASRPDGTWWSGDGGATFRRTEDRALTALAADEDGLWRAWAEEEPLLSVDGGRTWRRAEAPPLGRVVDAVRTADGWVALTPHGAWTSPDGATWAAVPPGPLALGTFREVLPDPTGVPGQPSALYLLLGDRLAVSEAGLAPFTLGSRRFSDPAGVLVGHLAAGHLVVADRTGVWESTDGGVAWSPLVDGLRDRAVEDLALGATGPVVATFRGLYRLEPDAVVDLSDGPPRDLGPSPWTLAEVARNRPGLREGATLGRGRRVLWRALPTVTLTGNVATPYNRDTDVDPAGPTSTSRSADWFVQVRLGWDGGAKLSPSAGTEFEVTDFATDDIDVLVVGGQVFANQEDLGGAAAALALSSSAYRAEVAGLVASLAASRMELLVEREALARADLKTLAMLELDIAEHTALLDAYTDGALSRSLAADATAPESP